MQSCSRGLEKADVDHREEREVGLDIGLWFGVCASSMG